MRGKKKTSESFTVTTHLTMPNDTNHLGDLMGGILMRWMDIAGAMAGMRHCNSPVVTAGVDHVSFDQPIPLGSVVILEGRVTRTFTTSLEVYIEVFKEDLDGERSRCNEAFFTFVSLDRETRRPKEAPAVVPETDRDHELYEGALRRRELRLIMAGRMEPGEAAHLKELFTGLP